MASTANRRMSQKQDTTHKHVLLKMMASSGCHWAVSTFNDGRGAGWVCYSLVCCAKRRLTRHRLWGSCRHTWWRLQSPDWDTVLGARWKRCLWLDEKRRTRATTSGRCLQMDKPTLFIQIHLLADINRKITTLFGQTSNVVMSNIQRNWLNGSQAGELKLVLHCGSLWVTSCPAAAF